MARFQRRGGGVGAGKVGVDEEVAVGDVNLHEVSGDVGSLSGLACSTFRRMNGCLLVVEGREWYVTYIFAQVRDIAVVHTGGREPCAWKEAEAGLGLAKGTGKEAIKGAPDETCAGFVGKEVG